MCCLILLFNGWSLFNTKNGRWVICMTSYALHSSPYILIPLTPSSCDTRLATIPQRPSHEIRYQLPPITHPNPSAFRLQVHQAECNGPGQWYGLPRCLRSRQPFCGLEGRETADNVLGEGLVFLGMLIWAQLLYRAMWTVYICSWPVTLSVVFLSLCLKLNVASSRSGASTAT